MRRSILSSVVTMAALGLILAASAHAQDDEGRCIAKRYKADSAILGILMKSAQVIAHPFWRRDSWTGAACMLRPMPRPAVPCWPVTSSVYAASW